MGRFSAVVMAGAAVVAALGGAAPIGAHQAEPFQFAPGHAGSDACRACHADQHDAWTGSTHAAAGGPPSARTVIAPFGGEPMRFADALVTPTADDQGGYAFVVEREGRPPLELAVTGVVGRGHMVGGGTQGFLSRFPDGTERFLPFDYSRDLDIWFCNTAFVGGFWVPGADRARLRADAGWLPVSDAMRLTECGDWPPVRVLGTTRRFANCQNCHGSQISVEYRPEQSRYETRFATLQINCESCHGPAADHVERARELYGDRPRSVRSGLHDGGGATADFDPGLPALDTLDPDASLAVCLQCHALKRAVGSDYSGGDYSGNDYSLGLPLVGDSPYLPDGRIATFGYQQTHRSSACYLFGSMTCVDCHDPHGQGYRDAFGNPLRGRFDDGQCTACHAAIAAAPERHTFHPAGSAGSACVGCHMPYVQLPALGDAIPYGRSDHTISIPRPGFDESLGLASACAGCHGDRTPGELRAQAADWWGAIRPHRAEVAALAAATADGAQAADRDRALTVAAALGARHGIAKVMAVDAWVRGQAAAGGVAGQAADVDDEGGDAGGELRETDAGPEAWLAGLDDEPGRALAALARDDDDDVRAVAAAALHATRRNHPDARALLDRLPRDEARPERLRARWAAALSQWAAAAERDGGPAAALPLLRRAQEVLPDAPEALTALGAGLAQVGATEEAVQMYLEALRRRPGDPVALVNLGLGLESLGRAADAEAVYERAAAVRPTEALAHLNLGNARLRRGDWGGAAAAYEAAIRNDFGLARAHLYLGVALANSARAQEALQSLRNALEFAPDDEEALDVMRQVQAIVGGPGR